MKDTEEINRSISQCLDAVMTVLNDEAKSVSVMREVLTGLYSRKCIEEIDGRFEHYSLQEIKKVVDILNAKG